MHVLHPALLRALVVDAKSGELATIWIPYAHILGILELPVVSRESKDEANLDDESLPSTPSSDVSSAAPAESYH